MRVHAICTLPQYRRHVEAVWKHLSPDVQGEMRTEQGASTRGWPTEDLVLIGGFYDMDRCPQNRMIYVEHGAGQSYDGDAKTKAHPAYHGSQHPDEVIGYICPNKRVADSWGKPAFVAGCPAIDGHDPEAAHHWKYQLTAAITFHWNAMRMASEAWSAKQHYIDGLHNMVAHLRSEGFDVIGTWHPRDPFGRQAWINIGVEHTPDPDEVLDRADLLVADNTSLQYEAAKLGIPNIVLNAPWYRKDVHHGLRFWDLVPGRQVDSLEQFMRLDIHGYVNDPLHVASQAARLVGDQVFEHAVGTAGQHAARWIEKFAAELG